MWSEKHICEGVKIGGEFLQCRNIPRLFFAAFYNLVTPRRCHTAGATGSVTSIFPHPVKAVLLPVLCLQTGYWYWVEKVSLGEAQGGASLPWKNFHAYKHESNGSNSVWHFLNFIWDMLKARFSSYLFFSHTPVLQPLETQWLSGEESFL